MYNNLWKVIINAYTISNILPQLCNLPYKKHNKIRLLQYISPSIIPIHRTKYLYPRHTRECDVRAYIQYLSKEM
ncbi:hypothetical protein [Clostridium botulinum]|uniref:hypothetical protein n=1 Tax=Clostridium botulinum TaxID=1491 RepID=UPI001E5DD27F|nr:hypothetical protein [Clostridium botulinum]MCD3329310.1 hypothetical protein [Clostridium botulinum D/C]MCD3344529.1 hypothetical protein [Clostridium botulinum D/C]MCD3353009.1 hypothetical protein [Clostridium botulinum D/C]